MGGHMGHWGSGHMDFETGITQRFHYSQNLLDSLSIQDDELILCYWDGNTNAWIPFNGSIEHNSDKNNFSLVSSEVYDYVAVFKGLVTNIDESENVIIPEDFGLIEAYPNPFNPSVSIQFSLAKQTDVSIQIFNVTGQLVSTITENKFGQGIHTVKWNGKTDSGNVAAGVV